MWVANSGSNDITVIVTTGSGGGQTFTGTRYTTGTRPVALAYDGSTYVWVANQAAFTVTRHTKVRFFGGFLWIGDASGSVLVRWTG